MVHIPPKSCSNVLYCSMYMRHSFDTNDFIGRKNQIKDEKLIFQPIEIVFFYQYLFDLVFVLY